MRTKQLELPLPSWGGARKGAGRKRSGRLARVEHARRGRVARYEPVHVTMRAVAGLDLRREDWRAQLEAALFAARDRHGLRIVHYSIQRNHLHLLVEVESQEALTRAMRSLAVRLAQLVKRLRGSAGPVWADRYHAHVLRTRREARNAARYVLDNHAHHAGGARLCDEFSSVRFIGAVTPDAPVVPPRTWLLRAAFQPA